MNKVIFVRSFLLFSLSSALHADSLITPENIAAQCEEIPQALQKKIDKFNVRHSDLLISIIPTTDNVAMTKEQIVGELGNSMQALVKERVMVPVRHLTVNGKEVIIPRNNYVIALPYEIDGSMYTIVFAGPWHKLHELESFNRKGWFEPLDPDKDKKSPTYQTITQAYHAKKCKEVVEKENITTFEVPEVYLAQVPGRKDIYEHASDENSFIVRKFYDEPWVSLQYDLKYVSRLSPKEIEELYAVTKGAGLQFLGDDGNLMINKHDYRLTMRDVQGPNDQNPNHPFNGQKPFNEQFSNSDAEYKKWHSFTCAICGFSKNILEAAQQEGFAVHDQREAWRNKVITDQDIASIHEGLRKQIYECVRHKN